MNNGDADDRATYREVRSLVRGLTLLEALAQGGWAKPSELAARTGIDRSSVYRLLNTLEEFGFVFRHGENGTVTLTEKVRTLADGVRGDEAGLQQVRPHLAALTAEIKWPSDLALLSSGVVTIQDSTHRLSPMTFHRAVVQQSRSLLGSSLGKAILAMLTADERRVVLEVASTVEPHDAAAVAGVLDDYRRRGFASAVGAVDPQLSAIALGFRGRSGMVGSVNIIFFRSVFSPNAAAERYLPKLRACVRTVADLL